MSFIDLSLARRQPDDHMRRAAIRPGVIRDRRQIELRRLVFYAAERAVQHASILIRNRIKPSPLDDGHPSEQMRPVLGEELNQSCQISEYVSTELTDMPDTGAGYDSLGAVCYTGAGCLPRRQPLY